MSCTLTFNGTSVEAEGTLTYPEGSERNPVAIVDYIPPITFFRVPLSRMTLVEPSGARKELINALAMDALLNSNSLAAEPGGWTIDQVAEAFDLALPHAGYASWAGGSGFFDYAKREPGAPKFRDTKRIRAACLDPEKAKAKRRARKANRKARK